MTLFCVAEQCPDLLNMLNSSFLYVDNFKIAALVVLDINVVMASKAESSQGL